MRDESRGKQKMKLSSVHVYDWESVSGKTTGAGEITEGKACLSPFLVTKWKLLTRLKSLEPVDT